MFLKVVMVVSKSQCAWVKNGDAPDPAGIVGTVPAGTHFRPVSTNNRMKWPQTTERLALERAQEYYEATVETDMSKVDNVPRDPGRVMRLMRSGNFFETLAVRDLRCYADAMGGHVSHYRDANGLECDAIVHLRDGRFGLVEVKLGGDPLINEGAAALNSLANSVDTEKMKKPSFKMVLTAVGDFAYTRPEDGIVVCPISALKN